MTRILRTYGIALILVMLAPHCASAAQIRLQRAPAGPGGTAMVDVMIVPDGKTLNVVEGIILFQGSTTDALAVSVDTAGSPLTLWPVSPQYDPKEKTIRFTGGAPGGFAKEGRIFRMQLSSSEGGAVQAAWIGGSAYLNDGKGTLEPVSSQSLTIRLQKDVSVPTAVEEGPNVENAGTGMPATMMSRTVVVYTLLCLAALIALAAIVRRRSSPPSRGRED